MQEMWVGGGILPFFLSMLSVRWALIRDLHPCMARADGYWRASVRLVLALAVQSGSLKGPNKITGT
jgi:hypothetical protein